MQALGGIRSEMAQIATNRFKLLLILIMATHSAFGYHWGALDPEITDDFVCNNQTCDGRPHSSCLIQQVSVRLSGVFDVINVYSSASH